MKDEIKRELSKLLPEDTSSDVITRLATYAESLLSKRQEEVKRLITDEMLVARHEGQPTSRLTSLYNKIMIK